MILFCPTNASTGAVKIADIQWTIGGAVLYVA